MMAHPPAPWTLCGHARLTLHLVSCHRARPYVPSELRIIPVLPRKTVGVVYLGTYAAGSDLHYHELIVAPALTYCRGRVGAWISHIYVDNPDSMAGGRDIWGLPKQLARFSWPEDATGEVHVYQGDRQLCAVGAARPRWLWRQPLIAPVFSRHDTSLLWFRGTATARLGLSRGDLKIRSDSPFATLALGSPWLTVHLREMKLMAHGPKRIGNYPVQPRSDSTLATALSSIR